MRLTATDKAIGELNMRGADIERALAYIKNTPAGVSTEDYIAGDLADIARCIALLRAVAPAPKPEKVAKPRAPRKSKKSQDTE